MRTGSGWVLGLGVMVACGGSDASPSPQGDAGVVRADAGARHGDASVDASSVADGLTYQADVQAVTSADQAQAGTFIPGYQRCVDPIDGVPGKGPNGQVCTNVMISGATEDGRKFTDYASCDVVRTQRPFWSEQPAGTTDPNDPRLQDTAYLAELAWVAQQVEATGCVCCHDGSTLGGKVAGQWDIRLGPLWLDSLSNDGLALFAGLADSSSLGAYDAADNNGFERDLTGLPSTDGPRMQKFMFDELARRGISQDQAKMVPPFGGPIYENRVAVPTPCGAGEGVAPDGTIHWNGGTARYVYVGTQESGNPGVPPNLDLPDGTLFRLDVLASNAPIMSGIAFGTTPAGTFQRMPASQPADVLQTGTEYHLTVLHDVGLPIANCLFTFGDDVAPAPSKPDASVSVPNDDAGISADSGTPSGACTLAGGDADGFGVPCTDSSMCTCAANYCALMPGQTQGYCSKTGCKEDPTVCPSNYSCFDISQFAPGQPSVCIH